MAADWWQDPRGGIGAGNLGPQPYGGQQSFPGVGNRGSTIGGIVGTAAGFGGFPGAGLVGSAIGTGFDVSNANDQLEGLGLGRNVAFGKSFANNAIPFGLAGSSVRSQFDENVTKAYPGLLQAMSIPPAFAGQQQGFQGTPSQGFFDSINDLGTVGNLGSTLDARGVPGAYQGAETGAGNSTGSDYGGRDSVGDFGGSESGNWRHGGPTGDDGDGRLEPIKGTLHEGEFVMSPEAVDMMGMKNMEMMNSMAQPRGSAVKAAMIEMLKSGRMGE